MLFSTLEADELAARMAEKRSMQTVFIARYEATCQTAIDQATTRGAMPIRCEQCGVLIPQEQLSALSGFQVHADIHSLDDAEYLRPGNLHIICSYDCHKKYKTEIYRFSDGKLWDTTIN